MMRTSLLLSLLAALASPARADDVALLRQSGSDIAISVRITRNHPDIKTPLGVNLVRSADDGDTIDFHWDVPVSGIVSKPSGSFTALAFTVSLPGNLYRKTETYVIAVPIIPETAGPATRAEIPVSRLDRAILADASTGFCSGGVMITLIGDNLPASDWDSIDKFFEKREEDPNTDLKFRTGSAGVYSDMPIRTLLRQTRDLTAVLLGAPYSICVNTIHQLPKNSFTAVFDFGAGAPDPLSCLSPLVTADLDARQSPSMKDASAAPGTVGARPLERNLDLGLAYTQSRDTKTGGTSRLGVMDLRLAPLLEVQRRIGHDFLSRQTIPNWYWFLTPLYIDANVASGRIVDNTVSLNRIAIGPQLEFRYMNLRAEPPKPATEPGKVPLPRYPNVHRFLVSANHYSDRDFKQREFVAKLEYQPLLGILNRPRETRWKSVTDPVTSKSVASVEPLGWKIAPKFGTEIGNTYHRRNPATAIQPSGFVRRGYAGLDVSLEINDYLAFSVTDTAYLRGEIAPGHLVNYIKLEADFPVGSPLRETSQTFFFTYERGSLPPFENLNAKALRLGYRIRSENWFGFRR